MVEAAHEVVHEKPPYQEQVWFFFETVLARLQNQFGISIEEISREYEIPLHAIKNSLRTRVIDDRLLQVTIDIWFDLEHISLDKRAVRDMVNDIRGQSGLFRWQIEQICGFKPRGILALLSRQYDHSPSARTRARLFRLSLLRDRVARGGDVLHCPS